MLKFFFFLIFNDMKKTYEEILAVLKESEVSLSDFAYQDFDATELGLGEIKEVEQKLKNGENPIVFKKILAHEIVKQLNNEGDAKEAEESFKSVVQDKNIPEDIPVLNVSNGQPLSKATPVGYRRNCKGIA